MQWEKISDLTSEVFNGFYVFEKDGKYFDQTTVFDIEHMDHFIKIPVPEYPKPIHKFGNRYVYEGDEYILCLVGSQTRDGRPMSLIHLKSGNRALNMCYVKDPTNVSLDEMNKMGLEDIELKTYSYDMKGWCSLDDIRNLVRKMDFIIAHSDKFDNTCFYSRDYFFEKTRFSDDYVFFPITLPQPPKKGIYSIGDKFNFMKNGREYMFVSAGKENQIVCVCIGGGIDDGSLGYRLSEPVKCNDVYNITEEEAKQLGLDPRYKKL